jgi:peptide-methionine (S)-S-oxide reductase
MDVAILGGGCFWCLEAVYQKIRGVDAVVSGYMGGHVASPSYEQVCGKRTGHAEVVRIEFDPAVVGFDDLLEVFFTIHDPTTPDRQGNDIGPQYRSVIFATNREQLTCAQQVIGILNRAANSGADVASAERVQRFAHFAFQDPVVTELIDASDGFNKVSGTVPDTVGQSEKDVAMVFWPAEEAHQNYFAQHPFQGYCQFVVAPKVAKAEQHCASLIAS